MASREDSEPRPYAAFGELVTRARKASRLTQEEAGERVGVQANHFSRYEQGRSIPRGDRKKKLEAFLLQYVSAADLAAALAPHGEAHVEVDSVTDPWERAKLLREYRTLPASSLDEYAGPPQRTSEMSDFPPKPDLLQSLSREEFLKLEGPSSDAMREAMERGRKARDAAAAANRRAPVVLEVRARARYRPAR